MCVSNNTIDAMRVAETLNLVLKPVGYHSEPVIHKTPNVLQATIINKPSGIDLIYVARSRDM